MKWFKHDTDGHRSEGLILLREKFGREWVCRWFEILEMVAEKMDETDRCDLKLPVSEWCRRLDCTAKKLRSFLEEAAKTTSLRFVEDAETLVIQIPNLLNKRDNYTANLQVTNKKLSPRRKKEDSEEEIRIPSKASDARENPPPEKQNGNSSFAWVKEREPEIHQLAQDLIAATGATDKQDRRDIAWDVYHACKAGQEQLVYTLIAEIALGEHDSVENIVASTRARLKKAYSP